MNADEERQMWLEYISKLTDRALNRGSASGVTTWAIIGALALLAFPILQRLPELNAEGWPIHLLAVTGILDLSLSALLFFTFFHGGISVESRLRPRLERTTHFEGAKYSVLLILAVLNVLSAIVAPSRHVPFASFVITVILVVSAGVVLGSVAHRRPKMHDGDYPEFRLLPLHFPQPIRMSMLAGLGIQLVCVLWLALDSVIRVRSEYHLATLIWAVQAAGFLWLSIILYLHGMTKTQSQFLEDLERRIVMDELFPKEIRSLFERELLGQPLKSWFREADADLQRYYDELQSSVDKFLLKLTELETRITGLSNLAECRAMTDAVSEVQRMQEEIHASYKACISRDKLAIRKVAYLSEQMAGVVEPRLFHDFAESWERRFSRLEDKFAEVHGLSSRIRDRVKSVLLAIQSSTPDTTGSESASQTDAPPQG